MTEEQVTKAILQYLQNKGWHIVCFDFPQSGTGRVLHPNNSDGEKNKESIIPDIVAVKNGIALFFENKDRFYLPDYKKVNELIVNNQFTSAIGNLLSEYNIENIYYGIGLPTEKHKGKSRESTNLVDFIVGVSVKEGIEILYNPNQIQF